MNYIYGVDVGGTTVKLGLFQDPGWLLMERNKISRHAGRGIFCRE